MIDAALREQLIRTFFNAFQSEASFLVHQKTLAREDCSPLVSSFARIAADQAIALCDAARREQTERDAKIAEAGPASCRYVDHAQGFCSCRDIALAIRADAAAGKASRCRGCGAYVDPDPATPDGRGHRVTNADGSPGYCGPVDTPADAGAGKERGDG